MSAHSDALKLLARRELSTAELRSRLLDRAHRPEDVDAVVSHLIADGSLDDARVARAYARTAAAVKARGRVRVLRELHAMGIAREIAAEAVDEVFGDINEEEAIERTIAKKTRGRQIRSIEERARLYRALLRQGFTPGAVSAVLRHFKASEDQ